MPSGVFEITGVPKNRVARVKANFELDNPTKIEVSPKFESDDGPFTVTATFPGPGFDSKPDDGN